MPRSDISYLVTFPGGTQMRTRSALWAIKVQQQFHGVHISEIGSSADPFGLR